ncbi:MAG: hypothetical protein H6591_07630 [Flavobacteriales bacterium]|nr:hypothetical protein [Flavobacteriales bacterium]
MRTFLFALLALCALAPATAVAQPDDMPPLSEERLKEVKAQRTAYITTKLGLTTEEAERFWPIYNEFDAEREKLRKELRENIRTTRKDGGALSEAQAKEVLEKGLVLRQRELDLERSYTDRFSKAIGAVKVVELHRAERDFNREVLKRIRERVEERRHSRPGGPGGR